MTRIAFEQMKSTIEQALLKAGMTAEQAAICAQVHTESSCDGIYSHGLNRVARFVDYLQRGWVNAGARAQQVKALTVMEIWDGQQGPGIINGLLAVDRAMALAKQHGIGLVAMRNSSHWMRGGTYGWRAAQQGMAAICWTNTEACMPAWGGKDARIGNNPFVMAVPGKPGPMVLDMAMSQYSYGKLEVTRLKGEQLPYAGGFDQQGNLTCDPGPIEASKRILPTGYWKGSGFAILLDAMAALLSAGNATPQIDKVGRGSCTGASQIFMVFDPEQLGGGDFTERMTQSIGDYVNSSEAAEGVSAVTWPGQRQRSTREENLRLGIPVDDNVWQQVQQLAENPSVSHN
ncbi:3-dehydro-L-gulonate 2-dehydrogenase [Erwiniaceae bacterium BAC15a-03b]|uniref:3-dehydro-L-gulonate 2-dehydrogenase n=1 Tax=Winslowiella arboricola TaxID=2978220 RepID=A0A9J6PPM8_9GAMM|nr:3-dehydro-L-gulonate 2-dehydrogenase [Winslowiella arboricola]MCU5775346.1 3-dehydro-L-gulonate 2-dehydrogenase [Winslowiella arboricola]MCU5780257.1 3-dehydro-L-gulonate 2-dehydrogenase [Winslowiella arboricola]